MAQLTFIPVVIPYPPSAGILPDKYRQIQRVHSILIRADQVISDISGLWFLCLFSQRNDVLRLYDVLLFSYRLSREKILGFETINDCIFRILGWLQILQ